MSSLINLVQNSPGDFYLFILSLLQVNLIKKNKNKTKSPIKS